jgi:G:T-mismatch repair DNA endonuclease (very short patch repair protein)
MSSTAEPSWGSTHYLGCASQPPAKQPPANLSEFTCVFQVHGMGMTPNQKEVTITKQCWVSNPKGFWHQHLQNGFIWTQQKTAKKPDQLGKLANVVMKQNKKKQNARQLKHKQQITWEAKSMKLQSTKQQKAEVEMIRWFIS